MTGFAEGFASGYGLMDATLKNKRDEEFKQKVLDAENAKTESTYETGRKVVGGFKELMRIVFDKYLRQ